MKKFPAARLSLRQESHPCPLGINLPINDSTKIHELRRLILPDEFIAFRATSRADKKVGQGMMNNVQSFL